MGCAHRQALANIAYLNETGWPPGDHSVQCQCGRWIGEQGHAAGAPEWAQGVRPVKASLLRRIWLAWWTWSFASLFAVLMGAITSSGAVLGVALLLAAWLGLYMLRNATN